MPDTPVLSLESVNALVPRLSQIIAEQRDRRDLIETALATLAAKLGTTPDDLDPTEGDAHDVAELRAEAKALVGSYRAAWGKIEELGAVVKDPRRGLLDFYGHVDGQLVWLCWQYGESEVSHYHGLDEGFPGRKPIEPAVRRRLLN